MPLSKTKSLLLVFVIGMGGGAIGLAVWIGSLLLMAHFHVFPDAKAVFNDMMIAFCALVGLPLLHRGLYRTYWNNDKREQQGLPALQGTYLDGNQPLPPPVPKSQRTAGQTAAYVACYAFGIAALFWVFVPLHHAGALLRFVGRHSSGTASAGSLLGLLIGYLPMAIMLGLLALFLNNDQQAIAKGDLPADEALRLRLKMDWLFAFVAALLGTAVLCQLVSSMTFQYL